MYQTDIIFPSFSRMVSRATSVSPRIHPTWLPSNYVVTLQHHHTSAIRLLPLPSPRWTFSDKDSIVLFVDVSHELAGNATLSLLIRVEVSLRPRILFAVPLLN